MNKCSKNGIKREGESCRLNNNCIYPECMENKIDYNAIMEEIGGQEYKLHHNYDRDGIGYPCTLIEKMIKEGISKALDIMAERVKNEAVVDWEYLGNNMTDDLDRELQNLEIYLVNGSVDEITETLKKELCA